MWDHFIEEYDASWAPNGKVMSLTIEAPKADILRRISHFVSPVHGERGTYRLGSKLLSICKLDDYSTTLYFIESEDERTKYENVRPYGGAQAPKL